MTRRTIRRRWPRRDGFSTDPVVFPHQVADIPTAGRHSCSRIGMCGAAGRAEGGPHAVPTQYQEHLNADGLVPRLSRDR